MASMITKGFGLQFLLGIGVGLIAREISRGIVMGRPALKQMLRSSMLLYNRSREGVARLSEDIEDLMAEVQADVHHEEKAHEIEELAEKVADNKKEKTAHAKK